MSQRRMFSPQIVDSDAFLDMPPTSQLLYFHLCMRADDDGFVGNPKKVLRMVGGNDDDLKILMGKRFILSFENGVVVIKHWLIHNSIRSDRYHETQYLEEKSTLAVKENKSYTEKNQLPLATIAQPSGNQMEPQVRLGKVRLEDTNDLFEKFWKLFPRKVSKKTALQKWEKINPDEDLYKKIILALEAYCKSEQWVKDKQFIPHPATWLHQERWNDELPTPAPKKPFYNNMPMKKFDGKWRVFDKGQWNEYGDNESKIEWKTT